MLQVWKLWRAAVAECATCVVNYFCDMTDFIRIDYCTGMDMSTPAEVATNAESITECVSKNKTDPVA